jgi:hypothetical protein
MYFYADDGAVLGVPLPQLRYRAVRPGKYYRARSSVWLFLLLMHSLALPVEQSSDVSDAFHQANQ